MCLPRLFFLVGAFSEAENPDYLMILEASRVLTPELLGLPKPCFPHAPTWARCRTDQIRPTPMNPKTWAQWCLQQPGLGASWDPGYAPTSSSHLTHPKTPQGSQWCFHTNLWALKGLQKVNGVKETKACLVEKCPSWGQGLLWGRSNVSSWYSVIFATYALPILLINRP